MTDATAPAPDARTAAPPAGWVQLLAGMAVALAIVLAAIAIGRAQVDSDTLVDRALMALSTIAIELWAIATAMAQLYGLRFLSGHARTVGRLAVAAWAWLAVVSVGRLVGIEPGAWLGCATLALAPLLTAATLLTVRRARRVAVIAMSALPGLAAIGAASPAFAATWSGIAVPTAFATALLTLRPQQPDDRGAP